MKLQIAILCPFLFLADFPTIIMGASTDEIMKGLDMDADGSVSQKDFLSFFQSFPGAPSKRNLRKLDDVDRSDACDPSTPIQQVAVTVREWAQSNGWDGETLFATYDTDNDGYLDTEECIQMLVDMGCEEEEVRAKDIELLDLMDRNGDGNVDVDEFKDVIIC